MKKRGVPRLELPSMDDQDKKLLAAEKKAEVEDENAEVIPARPRLGSNDGDLDDVINF